MKNKVSTFLSSGLVLGILALGVITSPAKALAQNGLPTGAEIPFSFQVGSTVMPAGSYIFRKTVPNVITLTNRSTGQSVFASTVSNDKKRPESDGAVVFAHYGDQYFLRGLDVAGTTVSYKCWPGKREQSLIRAANVHDQPTVALNAQPVLTR